MTELKQEATIRWMHRPPEGVPRVILGSESFPALPLDVDPHATHPFASSPGELLAAAIGSTFAWLSAEKLMKEGEQASELTASATLTLSGDAPDGTDMKLSAIACRLSGRVPGAEQRYVEDVTRAAMASCMETLGIRGASVAVTVEVSLEGT